MEAIPQVHILFALLFQDNDNVVVNVNDENEMVLFWTTFSLSVFSATFGIAKFLKLGPCRLVPTQGKSGGFVSAGFILLMVNITFTIVTNGYMLAFSRLLSNTISHECDIRSSDDCHYKYEKLRFIAGLRWAVPIVYGSGFLYVRKLLYFIMQLILCLQRSK